MANVPKHKYIKNSNLQKPHMIPQSSLKRLLAHMSNYLLPDNKSSDHRHTHTDRVSYAYKNKFKYDTHPNKNLLISVNY